MAAEAVTDAQQGGHHFSSSSKISKCFISFGLRLRALMKELCASELKPEGIILVSSSNTRFVNEGIMYVNYITGFLFQLAIVRLLCHYIPSYGHYPSKET